MCGADIWKKSASPIYRIHEKPDAKRVYDFEVTAAAFGYPLARPLPIHRVQFKSDRRVPLRHVQRPREIEIPKEVHITPRMYHKLTDKIAGKPEERILSYLMLRSLKQARYSRENHRPLCPRPPRKHALHFPIRRYPDSDRASHPETTRRDDSAEQPRRR